MRKIGQANRALVLTPAFAASAGTWVHSPRAGQAAAVRLGSLPRLLASSMLAGLLFCGPLWAQTDLPRAASGRPDLNGIWQSVNSANWNLEPHAAAQGAVETLGAIGAVVPGIGVVDGGAIPYLPAARAQREANFASRRSNDPEAKCFLPGVPRATYLPHPFRILQSDTDIMIVYQWAGAVRTIFMHDQIPAPVDSWMGWSNGRWEGDTLVVEVTGLNGQSWLDRSGNFVSKTARVVERYRLTGSDHIEYQATIEDPSVFERPWTIRMPLYRRLEPDAQLLEFKCVEFAEELMYRHLRKPGLTTDRED